MSLLSIRVPWYGRFLLFFLLATNPCALYLQATVKPKLAPPPGGGQKAMEAAPQKAPKGAARVRIHLRLVPYVKVIAKDKNLESYHAYRAVGKMQYTLRAKINRVNHFYIGNWHIETIPLSFNRRSKYYKLKLKLYKIYGNNSQLQEYVGSLTAEGGLVGGNHLYTFNGHRASKFTDRAGNPICQLDIGLSNNRGTKYLSKKAKP